MLNVEVSGAGQAYMHLYLACVRCIMGISGSKRVRIHLVVDPQLVEKARNFGLNLSKIL